MGFSDGYLVIAIGILIVAVGVLFFYVRSEIDEQKRVTECNNEAIMDLVKQWILDVRQQRREQEGDDRLNRAEHEMKIDENVRKISNPQGQNSVVDYTAISAMYGGFPIHPPTPPNSEDDDDDGSKLLVSDGGIDDEEDEYEDDDCIEYAGESENVSEDDVSELGDDECGDDQQGFSYFDNGFDNKNDAASLNVVKLGTPTPVEVVQQEIVAELEQTNTVMPVSAVTELDVLKNIDAGISIADTYRKMPVQKLRDLIVERGMATKEDAKQLKKPEAIKMLEIGIPVPRA